MGTRYALVVGLLLGGALGCTPERESVVLPGGSEVYIVFVESDLNGRICDTCMNKMQFQSPCDDGKFTFIWDDVMPALFRAAARRAVDIRRRGDKFAMEIYALKQNMGNPEMILRRGTGEIGKEPYLAYDRRRQREDLWKKWLEGAREAHRAIVAKGNNELHDVINSVTFLMDIMNTRQGVFDKASVGRVIYVDDMLHYNARGDTNAPAGLFNFAVRFSRAQFVRNVEERGTLYGSHRLDQKLAGSTKLEVYSVRVRRCETERLDGDGGPDYAEAYSESARAWRSVFHKLGARKVELNLTSLEGIIPEN